eukprot:m.166641 g.166641  ORF g.166641 m.166641 type:complete len:54 (+) comp16438_c0_seq4:76-237(+)
MTVIASLLYSCYNIHILFADHNATFLPLFSRHLVAIPITAQGSNTKRHKYCPW